MSLAFNQSAKNQVKRIDSDVLAQHLGIKDHRHWLKNTVTPKLNFLQEKTQQEIYLTEKRIKKGGRATKIVKFTHDQALLVVTLTWGVTEEAEKKKAEILDVVKELNSLIPKTPKSQHSLSTQWSERKNNILTTRTKLPKKLQKNPDITQDMVTEKNLAKAKGYFSPDVVFAEFLEKLEVELSYSMAWNWSMFPTGGKRPIFPATEKQAKIIEEYNRITQFEPAKDIWSYETLPLPPDYYLISEGEPLNGVCWVNYGGKLKEAFEHWVRRAGYIVDIYHDDNQRREFKIPSKAQEQLGCFESPEKESIPVENMTVVTEELLDEYATQFPKISGFKVHKDWLEWLASNDTKAKGARQFYLGTEYPVEFKTEWSWVLEGLVRDDKSIAFQYGDFEQYDNFWDVDNEADLKPNPNPPMFQRVRLYLDKYRPIFEAYLTNIWYPEHSVKYFQTLDPLGFPQLCAAMKTLPERHSLPYQFVEAMQPLLKAAE